MNGLHASALKHHAYAARLRRHFRKHPELSGAEYQTQQKIMEELTNLGLSPRRAGNTGVIAELSGALPGKTIALRADMDALPINDECGEACQSQNAGVCHACGHDAHMATLLGTVRVLNDLKDRLCGAYRFIFQPSEEAFPSGALAMIGDGALQGADAIIGAHIWQPLPLGTIGVSYGNLMAAPDKFTVTIKGKGGHGSMPHQTVDPIVTCAQIILALQTIVGRGIDPLAPAVLSVGSVHSGGAFNVIPDEAILEGTVRSFDESVRREIFSRIEEIVHGVGAANRAECKLEALFGHPAVVNHPGCARIVKRAAEACEEKLVVKETAPVMCAEDFSYYLQKIPGAFFFIGSGTEQCRYPHHHPKFAIDETAILHGMEVMARAAARLARKDTDA